MKKILVIGDTIVDKENYSTARGLSLESPTIKSNLKEKIYRLGGAANLVRHLKNFNTEIDFFTSTLGIGLDLLKQKNVNVINFSAPKLNVKSRYWVEKGDSSYKILQVNDTHPLTCNKKVISEFKEKVDIFSYEKVVVSDYRLGLVSKELVKLVSIKSNYSIGASQLSDNAPNYHWFSDFDIVVCNEDESKHTGNCKKVCITLGNRGCMIGEKTYPTSVVENVTTIGAGDAFLGAFAYSNDPVAANKYVKNFLEQAID